MVQYIQELAQVICEEGVKGSAGILASLSYHDYIHLVSINKIMCIFMVQSPFC